MERGMNRGMEVERGMKRVTWRDGGRERDGERDMEGWR